MVRPLPRLVGRCALVFAAMVAVVLMLAAGCGDSDEEAPTPAVTPTVTPASTFTPSPTATATVVPSPTPAPTPTSPAPTDEPIGFPIDPDQPVGWVDYEAPARPIEWDAGPGALAYSREDQPGNDPRRANAGGWNCRVHVAFEGRPAVDWYIPVGTPIHATMDGVATLYAITTTNAFDYYGVPRAPYVGFPESDASRSPFPGPGGGKGVFVEIDSGRFLTESAHLDIATTVSVVPSGAFLPGFTAADDLESRFAPMRGFLDVTPIATWEVRRGDVIGFSGDTGYSEAPHLHYTVRRAGGGGLLCPTSEAGFEDGGWLFR